MSEQLEYIDPKEIKRDAYQPRLFFKRIDELANSFEEDQQYDPVHIDANNYLIDGERRWLASLKLGVPLKVIRHSDVKTVEQRDAIRDSLGEHTDPIGIVERAWNYARRVAFINKGIDYTPQELQQMKVNDYEHLVNLQDAQTGGPNGTKAGGFSELARQISKRSGNEISAKYLQNHTLIIFISPKMLELIDKGEIKQSYGREIARLYKTPELMRNVEQEYLDGRFKTSDEISKRVTDYQKEYKRSSEAEAIEIRQEQEIISEPEIIEEPPPKKPDLPPPEIPREIVSEKAKEIAAKPPKPKKTVKDKAKNSLLTSVGKGKSAEAKIDKAKELGIDVSKYLERLEQAIDKIDIDPKTAWDEGKKIITDVDEERKQAKQTEEQKKEIEKARKEGKEEARVEAKEELKKDPDFVAEVKREIISPPIPKPTPPDIPKPVIEEAKKLITFGVDTQLFLQLMEFTSARKILLEEAVILLIKKGLETEGYV